MAEILNLNMYHFLMVFLRLGSAFMLMPGFMTSFINTQVRLSIALALSIILMPLISTHLPPAPQDTATFITYTLSEITIGIFLGLVMQFLYFSLRFAANLAGQAIGFSNAQIFDPSFQSQTIVLESFLSMVALTVIFITDIRSIWIFFLV